MHPGQLQQPSTAGGVQRHLGGVLGTGAEIHKADGFLDQEGFQGFDIQAVGIHGNGEQPGTRRSEGFGHPEPAGVLHRDGIAGGEEHPGDQVEGAHEPAREQQVARIDRQAPHVPEHLAE